MNEFYREIKEGVSPNQLRQFKELIHKLFQCCQERMQYQSERFDLPDAELRCLLLFDGERYLTAKSIAQKMNVVKSRVTKIISGLVKRGLVQRVPDPEDSRVTLISLTSKGADRLQEINNFNDFVHKDVLMQLEPSQRKAMLTNLEVLKAMMESVKELMV